MNRKIKRLIKNFSGNGFLIYSFILTEIYRDKGYFLEWDNDADFDIFEALNISENLVNEVVNYSCLIGLFNQELWEEKNIITTKNIQEFWAKVAKIVKRKNQAVISDFLVKT
ncbi:hypothetical protein BTO04_02080 [Polaribacter sp. SA4-10]|nr:hypothetical protein BTO04_02080 [Polaribacter sp. SA4-10]